MKNLQWVLIALLAASAARAAQSYRLNSSNTHVSFVVQHLGIQWITARFSDIQGEFILDDPGGGSRVDVTVGVDSLDTNQPRWTEKLRSVEWLDVQRYPRMTYHSSSIEFADEGAVANGELTLHGVTRPMMLTVTLMNCVPGSACRFSAHGRIKRSEYGLPHGFWSGGDQVDIAISGTLAAFVSRAAARVTR